jgi:hypothetical protein
MYEYLAVSALRPGKRHVIEECLHAERQSPQRVQVIPVTIPAIRAVSLSALEILSSRATAMARIRKLFFRAKKCRMEADLPFLPADAESIAPKQQYWLHHARPENTTADRKIRVITESSPPGRWDRR